MNNQKTNYAFSSKSGKSITIALAGNANVGKSVIFNQLTGGNQIIGNWPGKTVEIQEGYIEKNGTKIRVVDLPGIYSLSAYSEEEVVTREFIIKEKPNAVIVVVDASALYRNLFFLLQILEMGVKTIVALNQYDMLEKDGFEIDVQKLSELLNIPVVKTIATKNIGLKELFERTLHAVSMPYIPKFPKYGKEVEERVRKLEEILSPYDFDVSKRFVSIKLLEHDDEFEKLVQKEILELRDKLASELEEIHGEPIKTIIIQERYALASRITAEALRKKAKKSLDFSNKIDDILLHPVFGFFFLTLILLFMFFVVFKFGSFLSDYLGGLFDRLKPYFMSLKINESLKTFLWDGVIDGLVAAFGIVLPYIAPFYLLLSFLEDSGYLARIAFLTDAFMHKLGIHGKAFIPLIESFGCNVPAIMGTRVLERRRDRIIVSILATLVPCSARSVIVFGLVAAFLGPIYAILIYVLDFLFIFIVGLLLNRYVKGAPTGLIMEMPRYRTPVIRVILKQTWVRLKDFFTFATPIIVVSNAVMEGLILLNLLPYLEIGVKPFAYILGLPSLATLTLIFGALRKELTLIMLATFYKTSNFSLVLTPVQIFVYGFVTMIYIPCVATIAMLKREFGTKIATLITLFEFVLSMILGGVLNLILRLV
ncbi:ferrous iron transport protein B [Caldisericum exile]|uniref:Ferrous iron transport protein B n=1 Tax=Caldisericum exile (strain DSM 21853 / NBRC 104410 / AZM16c01) TaxID=511051 RepID=A0A7U6JFA5_CALEA|nr:ferrous iron transport protein B [Caldisericum exile]BAL81591.1 ferrous iron transport protein B [Caldisericum exile AZM16c01]